MNTVAIIGGSGFDTFPNLTIDQREQVTTDYGEALLIRGSLAAQPLLFVPRHGESHHLPPHRINYRANLKALAEAGGRDIIALAAVGGIHDSCQPGTLCIPDQIIDYTYGRAHSYYDTDTIDQPVTHIDFSHPYSEPLRQRLLQTAAQQSIAIRAHGCLAVTQGPRLETAAEIRRIERDGGDLVGMTGMPEAALARELGLNYATVAFVVNWAAGKDPNTTVIEMADLAVYFQHCSDIISTLLTALVASDQ
jgi:5'-methylthioinosine phosphorylase